jgi:hypothetical protein
MDSEIIIVSGLPRSGTSLMMQMLDQGGIEVVTDHIRSADTDNPRGYYELEKVKRIKQDASWLPELGGKVVKMVSQLLYDLPSGQRYRIIFMERDLNEVLHSQEKMLQHLGRPAAPREAMKQAYLLHLERLRDWLGGQRHMQVLLVNYNDLMERSQEQAERVAAFLDGRPDVARMVRSVDPSLYRNRKAGNDRPART